MDDKRQKLKQIWTVIVMISTFLWFVVSANSEIWKDEFDNEKLEGWTLEGDEFTWKVKDGFLRVETRTRQLFKYELLQLTAIKGPYRIFTITVKNIGSKRANIGIGLAKIFPDAPGDKRFFYVFTTYSIQAQRFDGRNGSAPFLIRIPKHPGTLWETPELKEMILTFNTGRFQMFANGELRADFDDPDFDQLDIIGFVTIGAKETVGIGEAWADSFAISDSVLRVELKSKLTTTWGNMKRGHLF